LSLRDFTVAAGLLAAAAAGFAMGRTGKDISVPAGIVSVSTAEAAPKTVPTSGAGATVDTTPAPKRAREKYQPTIETKLENIAWRFKWDTDHSDGMPEFEPYRDSGGNVDVDALRRNMDLFYETANANAALRKRNVPATVQYNQLQIKKITNEIAGRPEYYGLEEWDPKNIGREP
jgi:hypothetical protein